MYTLKDNAFQGHTPQIHEEAFVAPMVFLSGDVRIAKYASIWPGVVARGDVNYISVGECSNVQDLSCLHVADDKPCIIGDYVTIGHSAVVHGCVLEDHVLIGMNATVLTGAKVGRGSIIAAGALASWVLCLFWLKEPQGGFSDEYHMSSVDKKIAEEEAAAQRGGAA